MPISRILGSSYIDSIQTVRFGRWLPLAIRVCPFQVLTSGPCHIAPDEERLVLVPLIVLAPQLANTEQGYRDVDDLAAFKRIGDISPRMQKLIESFGDRLYSLLSLLIQKVSAYMRIYFALFCSTLNLKIQRQNIAPHLQLILIPSPSPPSLSKVRDWAWDRAAYVKTTIPVYLCWNRPLVSLFVNLSGVV